MRGEKEYTYSSALWRGQLGLAGYILNRTNREELRNIHSLMAVNGAPYKLTDLSQHHLLWIRSPIATHIELYISWQYIYTWIQRKAVCKLVGWKAMKCKGKQCDSLALKNLARKRQLAQALKISLCLPQCFSLSIQTVSGKGCSPLSLDLMMGHRGTVLS